MSTWTLDTCGCVMDENWDYSGPKPVRTLLQIKTACSLHSQAADPLDAAYGELKLRNENRELMKKELPELTYKGWKESRPQLEQDIMTNLEQLRIVKPGSLKPGLDFGEVESWEPNEDGTRKLVIDATKLELTATQQTKLKTRIDKDFGKDKIKFK